MNVDLFIEKFKELESEISKYESVLRDLATQTAWARVAMGGAAKTCSMEIEVPVGMVRTYVQNKLDAAVAKHALWKEKVDRWAAEINEQE